MFIGAIIGGLLFAISGGILEGFAFAMQMLITGVIFGGIIGAIIKKIVNYISKENYRVEREEKARIKSELEQQAASGDSDALNKIIEMGTEVKKFVNAAGKLPADAETKAFEIIHDSIVRNGGTNNFNIIVARPGSNNGYLKEWRNWYESSKEEKIYLTFVMGHRQDYTDMNGRTQNGDICDIEFYIHLKMLPNIVSVIANEAELKIKEYLSRKGLQLLK
jgi:hypothetical protein